MSAVPASVPSAVAPSAATSVAILTEPQLGPYQPSTGKSVVPSVPRSGNELPENTNPQPQYGYTGTAGTEGLSGNPGAPSVPDRGFFFRRGPVDQHYMSEYEPADPYGKVNNPPTRGMWTRIQDFLNHIAYSQNTTNTGFKVSGDQQRTSVMRNALPNRGGGFAPETAVPWYRPESDATYKFMPSTGTDPAGTGVLNSESLGAGQTAGGIGGNNYTPTIGGTPDTTNAAGGNGSGMPVWG